MRPQLVLHDFGIEFTGKLISFDEFSKSVQFKQTVAKYSPAHSVPCLQCLNGVSPQADPLITLEALAFRDTLPKKNQLEI